MRSYQRSPKAANAAAGEIHRLCIIGHTEFGQPAW